MASPRNRTVTLVASPLRLVLIVAAALALNLFMFAPRLWLMTDARPGTYEWDRGTTYLRQCQAPFTHDIEPAMQWRLLPPLVASGLGLAGRTPFVVPWMGVLALSGYVAVLFRRRLADIRWIAGGTLLFCSTSAILVPCHWYGLNDAWVWIGLLAVAFGRSRWALPLACLLCPWIDERFIIGFPLAWLVARIDRDEHWWSVHLLAGLWLIPYGLVRISVSLTYPAMASASMGFVGDSLQDALLWLPLAPLAWWMGLRAAWLPIVHAIRSTKTPYRTIGLIILVLTLAVNALIAADLSRSVAVLCPVVLLGCWRFVREYPSTAPRSMLLLGIGSLFLPAIHVIGAKTAVISPLPVELLRLLGYHH